MNKTELKNAIRELHRINIMISKDCEHYNKQIDEHFNSDAQTESQNVSENEDKERIISILEKHSLDFADEIYLYIERNIWKQP